jgi:hypothetical protein
VNSQYSVSIRLLLDPTISQEGNENCALLGYYASSSGDTLWTIRDNLSNYRSLNMGPKDCTETSERNYHYSLHNSPEERSSHILRGGSLKSQLEHFPVKSAPGSPSCFFTIDFAKHHFCMQCLFLYIYAFRIPHSFRPVAFTNYGAPYDVIFQSTNQQ